MKRILIALISVALVLSQSPSALAAKKYPNIKTKVFNGTGDDVVSYEVSKSAIVSFECATCTDNTVVKTNGPDSLLVNEIGAYKGEHLINMRSGSLTTEFEIEANSSWTLTIKSLNTAKKVTGKTVSGTGSTVINIQSKSSKATFQNIGNSNFVVYFYPESGFSWSPLLINEIGSYRGTKKMNTPAIVHIITDGEWSIKLG